MKALVLNSDGTTIEYTTLEEVNRRIIRNRDTATILEGLIITAQDNLKELDGELETLRTLQILMKTLTPVPGTSPNSEDDPYWDDLVNKLNRIE